MTNKKSKVSADNKPTFPFTNAIWENLWALANEGRSEVHKQTTALISLVDGALHGATKLATSLNNRADSLGEMGIKGADKGGRDLALTALNSGQKVLRSYRNNATQLVSSTRDGARTVATKAGATAQVILAPADKAA